MIDHLDHLVLTTFDEAACVDFYTRVLGMTLESFIGGTPPVERKTFKFGHQKINLHVRGREFEPKAHLPVPGALDLCFSVDVAAPGDRFTFESGGVPVVVVPMVRCRFVRCHLPRCCSMVDRVVKSRA